MQVIRYPKLADDIRDVAMHYAEISERVLSACWSELDSVLAAVGRNTATFGRGSEIGDDQLFGDPGEEFLISIHSGDG